MLCNKLLIGHATQCKQLTASCSVISYWLVTLHSVSN